jgi:hypothetical protein
MPKSEARIFVSAGFVQLGILTRKNDLFGHKNVIIWVVIEGF